MLCRLGSLLQCSVLQISESSYYKSKFFIEYAQAQEGEELMTERKYVYPAIFTPEDGAYSVVFPDLEITTSGKTLVEAIDMAQDALCLMIYDMEERKADIPAASSITDLNYEAGSFSSLIECDTMEYRRYCDRK